MAASSYRMGYVASLLALVFVVAASAGWYALAASGDAPGQSGVGVSELAETDADIKVYKTATCGCCSAWVAHLRDHSLSVEAVDVPQEQLNAVKQQAGLNRELASCHTAFIDGYVVEGHVPAGDIRRLVQERPDVKGLAVPGMPVGSPGMEMGDRRDPYDVLAFDDSGVARVFSSHHRQGR